MEEFRTAAALTKSPAPLLSARRARKPLLRRSQGQDRRKEPAAAANRRPVAAVGRAPTGEREERRGHEGWEARGGARHGGKGKSGAWVASYNAAL